VTPKVPPLSQQHLTAGPYPEPGETSLPLSHYLIFAVTSSPLCLSHITPFPAFSSSNLYAFSLPSCPRPTTSLANHVLFNFITIKKIGEEDRQIPRRFSLISSYFVFLGPIIYLDILFSHLLNMCDAFVIVEMYIF